MTELDDPDFYFEDEDFEDVPDAYQCMCCGCAQLNTGFGHTCNKCGAGALDEIYY
jgi:hypothetical protein